MSLLGALLTAGLPVVLPALSALSFVPQPNTRTETVTTTNKEITFRIRALYFYSKSRSVALVLKSQLILGADCILC